MIVGIGTDLIEIERVVRACERRAFLLRVFSKQEQENIEKHKHMAADNFAVKEAVVKMFGEGFRGIKPNEIEVLRDELGKPYVNLYGEAKKRKEQLGITKVHVTISNTKELSSAYVIGES